LKFLVDTQLPKVLARCLEREGHVAEHVLDLDLGQSTDNDVWRHAEEIDAVIVSKDEDFAQWVMSGRRGPKVVWLRVGNCTNAELVDWLLPVWPDVVRALESGERLVEVF
jgi:predicted nuclease of predicted toxin-antitoxin system